MLRLAQRWEKTDNADDRDRAKSLRAALALIEQKGVENLFKDMVKGLGTKNPNSQELKNLLGNDTKLIAALQEILSTLETEDEAERIRKQIKELEEAIKAITEVNESRRSTAPETRTRCSDPNNVAKEQGQIAKETQDIANRLDKNNKGNPNAGAQKNDDRAEAKPESKPGESSPEAKPETQENKAANKPDGASAPMAGMGEPKPTPMDAGMSSDKPSPMGGMPAGDQKPMSGKPMDPAADQKPMSGNPKAEGDNKGDQKRSSGQKGGDGKPMTGKPDMPMSGSPSSSKPSSGQPSSGQPSSGQPAVGNRAAASPRRRTRPSRTCKKPCRSRRRAQEDIEQNKRNDGSKKQDAGNPGSSNGHQGTRKAPQAAPRKGTGQAAGQPRRARRPHAPHADRGQGRDRRASTRRVVARTSNQKTTAEIQKSQAEADKEEPRSSPRPRRPQADGGRRLGGRVRRACSRGEGATWKRPEAPQRGPRRRGQTQHIEQDIIDQLKMMKEALKKAKQDLENQQSKPRSRKTAGQAATRS